MNMKKNSITLLGYPVFTGVFSEMLLTENRIINTINPHSYVVAKKDKLFSNSLKCSDILLPDGVGIVMAINILFKKKIKTLTGPDAMNFMLNHAQDLGCRVFFLGSTDFVLNSIKNKCAELYPNIKINSYSPPFVDEFSAKDNDLIVERINQFNPDILFVGMTAPKQEKWVYTNHRLIDVKKVLAVGAAFDWFCGVRAPPSKVWMDMGLGWFVRFLGEPKRMFRRVFISSTIYIVDIIIAFFTKKYD
jgi:N-acetylglucosaminyldiphosphoundecaprenol N-acetyl-beta-D-mannosaminyltransferase